MEFLDPQIDSYVTAHSEKEPTTLLALNRDTHLNVLIPRMLSGHIQGRVLAMLSQMIRPKRILEIGTYTGYSAICLAEGLQENGKLFTLDINEELEEMVNKYFNEANISDKTEYIIGNALDIIPELKESWDLVFIDADKDNYSNYYNLIIDKMPSGGYIIADNVLWSGKVIEDYDSQDKDTKALIDFNTMVQADNRVENVLFPIRDGLMICRKK